MPLCARGALVVLGAFASGCAIGEASAQTVAPDVAGSDARNDSGASNARCYCAPLTVPLIRLAEPIVRGALSTAVVRRVVRGRINEIRYCYEQTLSHDPRARGAGTLLLTVAPDGSVARSTIATLSASIEPSRACIENVGRRWAFPASELRHATEVRLAFEMHVPDDARPPDVPLCPLCAR